MTLSVVRDTADQNESSFADFWTLWPKRVARMEAEKAWRRLTAVQHVAALTALCDWRSVWIAEGRMQYVPHASSWLNGQRWEDELPEKWAASHASHVAAKLPADSVRTLIPQHVKDAIARLKK